MLGYAVPWFPRRLVVQVAGTNLVEWNLWTESHGGQHRSVSDRALIGEARIVPFHVQKSHRFNLAENSNEDGTYSPFWKAQAHHRERTSINGMSGTYPRP